jgi:hypothetical protein
MRPTQFARESYFHVLGGNGSASVCYTLALEFERVVYLVVVVVAAVVSLVFIVVAAVVVLVVFH